ncbi:MAG: signal peptidase I [Gammaproteobacteria bacterium]
MDFALLLVVATFLTGVIWAGDAFFLKKRRLKRGAQSGAGDSSVGHEPIVVEYARSFFPVLLLVLVLRSFLFEPFRIPSGSMMPTLLEGDFIFVNKFAYGLRLPVINTKILEIGEPEHGDVVVFKLPSDPRINYIKRVVGLPGDVVTYDQGSKRLNINGEAVPLDDLGIYEGNSGLRLAREGLGDGDHLLLLTQDRLSPGGTYVVPEGHYFMMGDNRDNSRDSRFEGVRFIPEYRLVGKAVRIWMNWRWPAQGGPLWNRVGDRIE